MTGNASQSTPVTIVDPREGQQQPTKTIADIEQPQCPKTSDDERQQQVGDVSESLPIKAVPESQTPALLTSKEEEDGKTGTDQVGKVCSSEKKITRQDQKGPELEEKAATKPNPDVITAKKEEEEKKREGRSNPRALINCFDSPLRPSLGKK